jgi:pimeloyl-ACP methyl ester carboxylesterase
VTPATAARPSPPSTGSRRRRRLVAALVSGALALSGTVAAAGTAAADGKDHVVSVPVEFHVQVPNLLTQGCLGTSVAGPATLRGTLTGPKEALEKPTTVGSVLSHGDGYDESFWTFPVTGYDVADELAQRGHVSVSYDRLGYGDSDKPNGNGICYATEASVLKQAIDQLRAGTYTTEDAATKPKFSRVGLFGHSASGFIVEYLAGNLGGVDALGAISTGLTGSRPLVFQRALEQQTRCTLTGPHPNGYAGLEADDAQFAADHLNAGIDPTIAAILTRNRTKDACAGTLNLQNILQNELATNARVRVPVLVVAGANDMFFPNAAGHAATFVNAPRTVKVIPDTPHAIAFSGQRHVFTDTLDAFLTANAL